MTALSRRAVVAGLASVPFAAAVSGGDPRLAALEARSGGRLGVAVVDTGSARRLVHRADERFPMCSTFKLLAAAVVLDRVDRGVERLDRRIAIPGGDILPNSPTTAANAGGELTLAALCEAAITLSDNSAANLLLTSFGGPAALTAFARVLGDRVTRLDRNEPALNDAPPGDPRDTTSPAAMARTLRRLVLRDALSLGSRSQLTGWLVGNRTGAARLRAGLPPEWRVGDKTGAWSGNGTTNDVAVIWPQNRAPLVVAAYLTRSPLDDNGRNAILAEVGRIAATI